MDVRLRTGLVEVPGSLPTFASAGVERRAAEVARIAMSSYDYLAELLGHRPEAQLLVLDEAGWAEKGRVPLFGLPNADEGTLVVAGTDADWWSTLAEMVDDDARPALDEVYAGPDGRLAFGGFFDLVAVHEIAHLLAADVVRFPRKWLGELFANLCLHAWVDRQAPAALATLVTLPRLAARAPADAFERRTRDEFERDYSDMSGPNYVWYQFRLQVAAAALFESSGEGSARRLFDAFAVATDDAPDPETEEPPSIDDERLAEVLAREVDPVLGAFSLAF